MTWVVGEVGVKKSIISALLLTRMLSAEIGCMDKSFHAVYCYKKETCCCHPSDPKKLYYVYCSCPCDRYPHDPKYGRCMMCRHYRNPINTFANYLIKYDNFDDYLERVGFYLARISIPPAPGDYCPLYSSIRTCKRAY